MTRGPKLAKRVLSVSGETSQRSLTLDTCPKSPRMVRQDAIASDVEVLIHITVRSGIKKTGLSDDGTMDARCRPTRSGG